MSDAQRNGKPSKSYKADGLTVPQRILLVLSDGLPHKIEELHACLHDTDAPFTNVHQHISNLRKTMRPKGEDIICRTSGYDRRYQHVRLIGNPYV